MALGAWADVVTRKLGYRLPLAVKRGYHMHYKPIGNAVLNRPTLDFERGYFLAPMARGIRLTTGAEFALRDDPPTRRCSSPAPSRSPRSSSPSANGSIPIPGWGRGPARRT